MKRLHVHISVTDLAQSTRFYSAMFGQAPTIAKPDYAKWEVDDPQVVLAISERADNVPGIDHLGIKAGTGEELAELFANLENASIAMLEERGARCCYATSDKHWASDPQGVVWEMFHTMGAATTYGEDRGPMVAAEREATPAPACC